MSAPFKPGDVVVCVDDSSCPCCEGPSPIRRGSAYRVLHWYPAEDESGEGVEIAGVDPSAPHEGFRASRFRKIDEGVTPAFREQLRKLGKKRERAA